MLICLWEKIIDHYSAVAPGICLGFSYSHWAPMMDSIYLKGIYFVIYGIISEFTDKGQFQYITNLKGPQEGTYLYTTQFLSLR